MADFRRVTTGPEGVTVTDTAHSPQLQIQRDAAEAPAASTRVTIASEHQMGLNTADGRVIRRSITSLNMGERPQSNDPLDDPRSPTGSPQDRSTMTEDSIITVNGMELRAKEAVRMGLLSPSPRGGYEWSAGNGPVKLGEPRERGRSL